MSAMSNARWLTLAQAARIVLQLVSLVILARLLPPSEYGLLAMATVAMNFAYLLRDMGTAAAIVQKEDLSDHTTNTVFWLNVGMGLLLAAVLCAASPVAASYFRTERLAPVLCLLAVAFPVTSASAVHQALLERRSGFRTLARVELVSALSGLLAAVALAYAGFGVYALVWQTLTAAAVSTVQLWLANGWRPKWVWSMDEFKSLWGFSGNLTGFSFINFFARNADSLVIGRVLGQVQLGIYAQAYKLMMFPLQSMSAVAGRALFPVMSRQQNDRPQMALLYLRALRLIATMTAPMMAGLWVLREPFVTVALGPKWATVPIVLAWLAPVGFIQSLITTTGTVFMSTGRTDLMMRLGLLGAILQVGSFFIGVQWGIEGVAICYLVANVLNGLPHFYYATRQLHSDLGALTRAVWQAPLFALLMVAAIYPAQQWLLGRQASPQVQLIVVALLGAAVYGALTFAFSKALVQDLKKMAGLGG